jgi:hypothetical protein
MCPVVAELFHTAGQKEMWTDMTELRVPFRKRA